MSIYGRLVFRNCWQVSVDFSWLADWRRDVILFRKTVQWNNRSSVDLIHVFDASGQKEGRQGSTNQSGNGGVKSKNMVIVIIFNVSPFWKQGLEQNAEH